MTLSQLRKWCNEAHQLPNYSPDLPIVLYEDNDMPVEEMSITKACINRVVSDEFGTTHVETEEHFVVSIQ